MSTIITVYSHDAFKSFLLPAINDADHSILLSESLFNTSKDIELKLEIRDGRWFFVFSEDYDIEYLTSDEDCYIKSLKEDVADGNNEGSIIFSM